MKYLSFYSILFYAVFSVNAQSSLSIDQLMEGNRFIGFSPENPYWAEDGSKIYFNWNPGKERNSSLYSIRVKNGKTEEGPQKVSEEELRTMPAQFGVYNRDRSQKLYVKDGDIYWYNKGQLIQITNTLETERSPSFGSDEKSIVFIKGDNLFKWSTALGTIRQLTDFRAGNEEKAKENPTEEKWLENQQLSLMQILKERKENADRNKKLNEQIKPKRPKTYYLQGKEIEQIQLSPREDFITFRLLLRARPKGTTVPNYVTQSGFTTDLNARSKVGIQQDKYEFGIYDLKRDSIYLLDTRQLTGIEDLPEYYKEYKRNPAKKEARSVIPFGPFWSVDGKNAVLVFRSQDSKDRWIVLLDLQKASLQLLDRQRDEAWIGGPGISFFQSSGNVGWMPDNEHFYFQSEKTGYSHLYTVNVRTGEVKSLTSGKFEVREAYLSKDKNRWYLSTNEVHPGEYYFYEMPLNGGNRTRLTQKTGMYESVLSPDQKYLLLRYSFSNQPWELYLKENKPDAREIQLTFSLTPEFKAYPWLAPPIVTFKASDGAEVHARLYRPKNPEKQGKAVIFVHGAGYLQNVHQGWSSYYREYLFHHFLMEKGYTVLDIDYRASDGYGRDWRTGIYRWMGGKDLSDQVDGAKFLVEKYDISPQKIGIYGGSYGGFITLMALFTQPEIFKAGAALRPVTDWAHYNHPYTANILNTPVLDSLAYARSSSINFAGGLKGALLMCHGMIDDNVHFQDVVRLSQRLIELRKENWELAVYPLENHGFVEASSWADEYKRIFKLFEEHLK